MTNETVVVAGATGDLGLKITQALIKRGAAVRALVRTGADTAALRSAGAAPVEVSYDDPGALTAACTGAVCVVSALSGLREVIVTAQTALLDAAVAAGVLRFIASDYSIDYTGLPPGANRNFDLRREFRERLDHSPIRATSVFNGAFADMLVAEMPLIARPIRRIVHFGSADQSFALTTRLDTAAVTAAAALDPEAPRNLHVAGSSVSARDLASIMTDVTRQPYKTLRLRSLGRLEALTALARRLFPQPHATFPAWQGMQYLHNMFSGDAPSAPTDNDRYPGLHFTPVRDVIARAA